MSNVDINVDGRKIGRLYRTLLQAGAIKRRYIPLYFKQICQYFLVFENVLQKICQYFLVFENVLQAELHFSKTT